MRKSKYGEDTVAVRVPKSRKQDVLTFLRQFEVIDSMSNDLKELEQSDEVKAYQRGYMEGFKKGEKTQFLMGYSFAGSKEDVQLALDVWEKRVPDSVSHQAMIRLGEVLLNTDVDVGNKLFSLANQTEKK